VLLTARERYARLAVSRQGHMFASIGVYAFRRDQARCGLDADFQGELKQDKGNGDACGRGAALSHFFSLLHLARQRTTPRCAIYRLRYATMQHEQTTGCLTLSSVASL
jgi:hypothetical protein